MSANDALDLDDEYAQLSGIVDPRVLVTTSRDPSTRLSSFAKEIRLLLPTSIRLNRGNLILPNLISSAQASGLSDIVLLHEHRGVPTALTLSYFPYGPTVSFSLHNVVLRLVLFEIGALEEGDLHPDNVKRIATDLGVTETEVISMNRRMSGGDASLNATVGSEGEGTMQWQDWLEDEDADQATDYEERDELETRREMLAAVVSNLNDCYY